MFPKKLKFTQNGAESEYIKSLLNNMISFVLFEEAELNTKIL